MGSNRRSAVNAINSKLVAASIVAFVSIALTMPGTAAAEHSHIVNHPTQRIAANRPADSHRTPHAASPKQPPIVHGSAKKVPDLSGTWSLVEEWDDYSPPQTVDATYTFTRTAPNTYSIDNGVGYITTNVPISGPSFTLWDCNQGGIYSQKDQAACPESLGYWLSHWKVDFTAVGGNYTATGTFRYYPGVGAAHYGTLTATGPSITKEPSATVVNCTGAEDTNADWECKATVSDTGSAQLTPTGSVSFSTTGGSFTESSCELASDPKGAACSVGFDEPSSLPSSGVKITASYGGDTNFGSSSDSTQIARSEDPEVSDGDWEFGGCFTNPDKTDYDTTDQSQLDGLNIDPEAASSAGRGELHTPIAPRPSMGPSVAPQSNKGVDYSDGGKKGDQVISQVSVTMSLNIDGVDSPIWKGRLDWKLSGKPVTMTLPQGTFIKGVPVSGTLTLVPKAGGKVDGTILTVLPPVLGGGKAKLTFTSVYGKGVSQMQLIATNASLGKLFTVTKPTLTYANGKWDASGRVGTSSGPLDLKGSLTFDKKGNVSSGSLTASNVALGKLWNLQTFSVTYGGGTWQVLGKTKGANPSAFKGTLTYGKQGNLSKGSLEAANVSLGGMFSLKQAALTYSAAGGGSVWTASGRWGDAKKPSTFGGQLTYDGAGALVGGKLTVGNVALGKLFDVRSALFTYAAGPNGTVWTATADVVGADGNPVSFKGKVGYDAQGTLTDGSLAGTGLSLAGLFKLADVSFTYTSGQGSSTWSLVASATGSTGGQHHLEGSLTFDTNGTITGGHLKVEGLTVAGLITLNTFELTYDQAKGWDGSADIQEGNETAQVALSFTPEGQLMSGSFSAQNVPLFGVLELKTFDLTYDAAKGWDLSVTTTLKNGATAGATLKVVNGAVAGASFDLANVSFAGKLTIDTLSLNYTSADGQDTFKGAAMVTLPGPAGKSIKGTFEFVDEKFTQGSLEIKGLNVPLGYGIFLDKLGAAIAVQYDKNDTAQPVSLAGEAGLTAGPRTAAGAAMAVDGQLEYDWPLDQKPDKWDITGGVDVANVRLGNGEIVIEKGTTALTITLGAGDGSEGLHLGKLVTLHGKLSGTFDESSIEATGTANFTVGKYAIDGNVAFDAHGLAGCGSYNGSTAQYGFNWVWGQRPSLKLGDCSLDGF